MQRVNTESPSMGLELCVIFAKLVIYYMKLCLSLFGIFCHLLVTFPNSLDPDHDRQNVGPDLDPNRLTL